MSNPNDAPPPEDIAGLFRRFDGDAHGYKEFAPPEPVKAAPPKAWALLSGNKIERAAAPAPVLAPPVAPAPVTAPLVAAPAPVMAPPVAPAPTPAVATTAPVMAPAVAAAATPAPLRVPATPLAVFGPAAAPASAPVQAPAAVAAPVPATELQALFARLAELQPRAAAASNPMSRWRRPT